MKEKLFEIATLSFGGFTVDRTPVNKVTVAASDVLTEAFVHNSRFIVMDGMGANTTGAPQLISVANSIGSIVMHIWIKGDDDVYRWKAVVDVDYKFSFMLQVLDDDGTVNRADVKIYIPPRK